MFLDKVEEHPRANLMYDPSHFVLQALDYLAFIDHYHERIKTFHVKDAEFCPDGKSGAYGGYQPWSKRAGRFRSPGDGQVDFGAIFTKLTTYGFDGWAVLEWECFVKNPEDGAAEGARFIAEHIIRVSERAFDDFVKSGADRRANRAMLGLEVRRAGSRPKLRHVSGSDRRGDVARRSRRRGRDLHAELHPLPDRESADRSGL
jgi:hypothetical protein